MLGTYDRGRSSGGLIRKVQKYAGRESTVCAKLNELRECEIAVAHVSKKDWDSLIKRYSRPNSVRVRVSTAGFVNPPKPAISENEVYIFHLVPSTRRLDAQWREILHGLSDEEIVKSLIRGENLGGLRSFFVHEVQTYLSALTILCGGYLAIHAEDKTNHTDISSALALMKWSEFRNSDRYTELIQRNLGEKRDDIRQPEWWLNVFEQESFCDDVKKEWKDTTGTEEIPAALKDLLEAICSDESVVPPTIVADAYCVLQKKN